MDLDLHIHSNASDGTVAPADVVATAADARLDVIALTDHDTVAGVAEAIEAGWASRVEVIPGLEVSTTHDDVELHILGYFVDPTDPALVAHTGQAAKRRRERLRGIVRRLEDQGIEVDFDRVVELSGGGGALGRPHLARALVEAGYVESVSEAFDRFIGNEHSAYIPTRLIDPEGAIRLIRNAGGISVWAHPPMQHLDAFLPTLRDAGLAGLEVYRPRNSPERVRRLESAARRYGLLRSGGSDWHGPGSGTLGDFRVDASEVEGLLEAGGI